MKTYKYFLRMLSLIMLAGILCGNASGINMVVYYNGPAQPSTAADPTTPAFQNWCQGSCYRTTQFPLFEPIAGNTIGTAYVWERDMIFSADYSTMCLGEFVQLKFPVGSIYLAGTSSNGCGTFMNPQLVKPVSNPQALVAIFGGSGTIAGGTLLFQNVKGTYDVKLRLEVVNNVLTYYDYLFYNITLQ